MKFRVDVAMMCKMGFDIGLKDLNADELTFCQEAVANYHRLKPIILNGDFYRLVSPYDTEHMSVMYVGDNQKEAILYAYDIHPRYAESTYPVLLQGLDPVKMYKVEEINLMPDTESGTAINGQTYSGDYLMKVGVRVFSARQTTSHIFEITAVN